MKKKTATYLELEKEKTLREEGFKNEEKCFGQPVILFDYIDLFVINFTLLQSSITRRKLISQQKNFYQNY